MRSVHQFRVTRNSELFVDDEEITDLRAALQGELPQRQFGLQPGHLVFHWPNELTAKDFEGWVQERSLYHAEGWDARYTPLLGLADPGEAEDTGALIVAEHGKGHYVYTGLALFRQLPDGVPGATRLFANLLALGHAHD